MKNETGELTFSPPRITIPMVRAGVTAFLAWDPEAEEVDTMVSTVFWQMAKESPDFLIPVSPTNLHTEAIEKK